jgi:ribosomal protein L11 methyltransferase
LNFYTEFESVEETPTHLVVSYNESIQTKDSLLDFLNHQETIGAYAIDFVENKNWNEVYEKSFDPIVINQWGIRATFHAPLSVDHEIIIDPKMSFGTGHHETTKMMIQNMESVDFKDRSVFDYGSGTGILAFVASKMGAKKIKAIDNEEWAYKNSLENAVLNQAEHIEFMEADLQIALDQSFLGHGETFDIILANITKNILLQSSATLAGLSHSGTKILFSGFYEEDAADIISAYAPYGFKLEAQLVDNRWTSLVVSRS